MRKDYTLFLACLPKSVLEREKRATMWSVVVEKIILVVSKAQFDAKEDALTQRLANIEEELQAYAAVPATTV